MRAIDRGMELNAIAIAEAMELRRWKLGVGTLGRVKDDIRLCREASHRHARRLTGAVPGVDEAAEVGRDLREVDSRIASDPLHRSALERHPEDVPLQWALLPADKVHLSPPLVERDRRLGRPFARRHLPDQATIRRIQI